MIAAVRYLVAPSCDERDRSESGRRVAHDVCLCSDTPGWATVVSKSTSCLGTNAPSTQFIPQQCYSETSASFAVDQFHGVTIGPNVSVTITGPAKSPYGFNLLVMAMSSAGTVVFNGPTQLYDMQHGNTLLATVTGALPGTLKVAVTAAGRPSSLHKSMDGTVTKRRGEQPVITPPDLWKSSSVSSPAVSSLALHVLYSRIWYETNTRTTAFELINCFRTAT